MGKIDHASTLDLGIRLIPLARSVIEEVSERRIVLVGGSGAGKTASANTILGRREFGSERSSVTGSVAQATVSGRSVSVVDTPGLFYGGMRNEEMRMMLEISRSVSLSSPGPHAFLIVFSVNDRFADQQIPQMMKMMFGEEVFKYSIILFTHRSRLDEEERIKKLIEQNSALRAAVDQCGGRYHVFNNKDVNNREQVEDLLQKIDSMIQQNGGAHYTNQMTEDAEIHERRRRENPKRTNAQKSQEFLYPI
ncbi:GTPase IMAP family member 9-like [Danio aesculapii]|uniref:GTPase IMAP family member 9-like n=1 Tax=Danio aesculapii TaxID=1142201 RepID=UPI0024C0AC6B|nr:GTPase IMAP family member 9-like [Danio aesculapii]